MTTGKASKAKEQKIQRTGVHMVFEMITEAKVAGVQSSEKRR